MAIGRVNVSGGLIKGTEISLDKIEIAIEEVWNVTPISAYITQDSAYCKINDVLYVSYGDGCIRKLNKDTGEILLEMYVGAVVPVNAVAVDSNGDIYSSSGSLNKLIKWNSNGDKLWEINVGYTIYEILILSDGFVLVGCASGYVFIYNPTTQKQNATVRVGSTTIKNLTQDENGNIYFSLGSTNGIKKYSRELISISTFNINSSNDITYLSDNNLALYISGSPSSRVVVISSIDGSIIKNYPYNDVPILTKSENNDLIVTNVTNGISYLTIHDGNLNVKIGTPLNIQGDAKYNSARKTLKTDNDSEYYVVCNINIGKIKVYHKIA